VPFLQNDYQANYEDIPRISETQVSITVLKKSPLSSDSLFTDMQLLKEAITSSVVRIASQVKIVKSEVGGM
jgi:hypothetical protein